MAIDPRRWYTRTSITYRTLTSPGSEAWGGGTFSANQTLKGRFEYQRRLLENLGGRQVVSTATLFTRTALKPGDLVTDPVGGREREVVAVDETRGVDGTFTQYEVFLE